MRIDRNNFLEKKTVPQVSYTNEKKLSSEPTTSESAFNQPNDLSMDFNWTYQLPITSSSLTTSYLPTCELIQMNDMNGNLNK